MGRIRSLVPLRMPFAGNPAGRNRQWARRTRKPGAPLRCTRWKMNMASRPRWSFETSRPTRFPECIPETRPGDFPHIAAAWYSCTQALADDRRRRRSAWHLEAGPPVDRTPPSSTRAAYTFPTFRTRECAAPDCRAAKNRGIPDAAPEFRGHAGARYHGHICPGESCDTPASAQRPNSIATAFAWRLPPRSGRGVHAVRQHL